jgi:hypothetical protein
LTLKLSSQSKFFRDLNSASTSSNPNLENIFSSNDNVVQDSLVNEIISIKENDELTIKCSVNSSKPSANISIGLLRRPAASAASSYNSIKKRDVIFDLNDLKPSSRNFNRLADIVDDSDDISFNNDQSNHESEARKLDILDRNVVKNKDMTIKTIVSSRIVVNRFDNLKAVTCIAENSVLNEKWETKKVLNVLCNF